MKVCVLNPYRRDELAKGKTHTLELLFNLGNEMILSRRTETYDDYSRGARVQQYFQSQGWP